MLPYPRPARPKWHELSRIAKVCVLVMAAEAVFGLSLVLYLDYAVFARSENARGVVWPVWFVVFGLSTALMLWLLSRRWLRGLP